MTSDEIDGMEAGEALDQLVAEHVMGWTWQRPDPGMSRSYLCPPDFQQLYSNAITLPGHVWYCTDLSAAVEVLKVVAPRGALLAYHWTPKSEWHVTIECGEKQVCALADGLPLAICRAALKAVLVR